PDRRPVHVRGGRRAALDQLAADRSIRVAVVVGEADAHDRAVGQAHAPRTLHLQEEGLDRIVEPQQHLGLWQSLVLDLRARRIRALRTTVAQPGARAVGERDEVGRTRVQRDLAFAHARARAVQDRLVVAGEQAGAPAAGA